jgi:CRP-like cAMP-binding protein
LIDSITLLQKIPLFRTLTLENLHDISSKVEEILYEAGDIVFYNGDEGDALYIIKSGMVEIIGRDDDDQELHLAELSTGNYFGEMALLTGEPRSATVKAAASTILLRLSKDDFQLLLNRNAAMYIPISYVLSQRLKDGNEKRISEEVDLKQRYTPSGELADNSIIDLLKYCEENALTGRVVLKTADDIATMDYQRGEILTITLNDNTDIDYLSDLLGWSEGTFRIEPKPFVLAKRTGSTDRVEGAQLVVDEFTLKDLIAVFNLVCQHSVRIIGRTIVESFLKRTQKILNDRFPELYLFSVERGGFINLYEQSTNRRTKDDELIAMAVWIRKMIAECSKYDMKFETFDIRHVTHAYYDILKHIGFYDYYITADEV